MSRATRKTVGQRAIAAWHRVGSDLLHERDTPTVRTMAVRSFLRGYLAGWRAAKQERK